ncbi:MAG: hypothetical protein QF561_01190 [Phycisphaerales bacterium]|nr:hypothetical protein [Phycisphaerales bacterium]
MAESNHHQRLKRLSAGWLRGQGYVAVGAEVGLRAGGFRADMAGWTDRRLDRRGVPLRCSPRTCLIECKVSRADFARDGGRGARLLGRRARVVSMLRELNASPGRPLRRATRSDPMLFDLRGTTLDDVASRVRRLSLELVAIDQRLGGRCKFAKMAWWRAADLLLLAAPVGLIKRREIPWGWGLLEEEGGVLRVAVAGPQMESQPEDRLRILRGIAVSASRGRWVGATQLPLLTG